MPILEEIQGRTTDFIISQDGNVMHGLALIYVLRDIPGIKEFKIIQESREVTRILLMTDENYQAEDEKNIKAGFKSRLGQSVSIEIETVDNIPAEKSGKFRYVISHAV